MTAPSGIVWRIAALAATLALAPASARAAERTVIPFDINRFDHMVVEMVINGTERTTAVVDTAATFAMVASNVAVSSGVAPPPADARMVNILGVNGDRDFSVVRLDQVRTGNIHLLGLDAAYNDEIIVPGAASNVLPASAFRGDVLEFDFEARTITVYDGKPEQARSRYANAVSYTVDDGLIFIDIRINGKKGRALIDTGASISYVNSTFARRAGMRRNEDLTRYLLGATGDREAAWIATVRKVRVADFFVERPNLLVSDPVLIERLGLSDQPVMVLGLDFLSRFRLQFDRRSQKLILSVPGSQVGGVEMELQARATRLHD
ncbi:MAG: aspartyl protease family protein [Hyphomonas sp.]